MPFIGIERRHSRRYPNPDKIEYACNNHNIPKISKAVTINTNLSKSGLCLYVFKPLREGQDVTVISKYLHFANPGTVIWQEKIVENFYKVGLNFNRGKGKTSLNNPKHIIMDLIRK